MTAKKNNHSTSDDGGDIPFSGINIIFKSVSSNMDNDDIL